MLLLQVADALLPRRELKHCAPIVAVAFPFRPHSHYSFTSGSRCRCLQRWTSLGQLPGTGNAFSASISSFLGHSFDFTRQATKPAELIPITSHSPRVVPLLVHG